MPDWAGGPVVRCRTPAAAEVGRLFRERYAGFTVKYFHEHLRRSHGSAWGYTWTKAFLQSRGLVTRARAVARTSQASAPADGGHDAAPGRLAVACRVWRRSTW